MLQNFLKDYRQSIIWGLLAVVCILEFGLISWWAPGRKEDANLLHSVLLFLLGSGIGFYALWKSLSFEDSNLPLFQPKEYKVSTRILLYLLPFVGIVILMPILLHLFVDYPIDPKKSDIIPQIEIMARRFMNGEFPYNPIHDFGGELYSPYMPLHWGPFIVPEYFQFDARWWVLGIWFAANFLFTHISINYGKTLFHSIVLSVLPPLFIYLLLRNNFPVFCNTVELMILSYYFFLIIFLNQKNIWLIGLGLLFCLLSRYSLLFWAPLLFLPFLINKNYSKFLKLGVIVFGGILLLYVIPFLSKDWYLPLAGLEHHQMVSLKNWTFEPWFSPYGKPWALYRGTGLAVLFYEYWPGYVEAKMNAIQQVQLLGSVLLLIAFSIIYYLKKSNLNLSLFWLASLKVMLCFFYSFLVLPIDYYFIVPVFTSLGIMMNMGIRKSEAFF